MDVNGLAVDIWNRNKDKKFKRIKSMQMYQEKKKWKLVRKYGFDLLSGKFLSGILIFIKIEIIFI